MRTSGCPGGCTGISWRYLPQSSETRPAGSSVGGCNNRGGPDVSMAVRWKRRCRWRRRQTSPRWRGSSCRGCIRLRVGLSGSRPRTSCRASPHFKPVATRVHQHRGLGKFTWHQRSPAGLRPTQGPPEYGARREGKPRRPGTFSRIVLMPDRRTHLSSVRRPRARTFVEPGISERSPAIREPGISEGSPTMREPGYLEASAGRWDRRYSDGPRGAGYPRVRRIHATLRSW